MSINRLAPIMSIAAIASACSYNNVKEFSYNVGEQRACMQDNDNRPYESAKDLDCMTASQPGEMSYQDYQRARGDELSTGD
jgi:hypothetical protein